MAGVRSGLWNGLGPIGGVQSMDSTAVVILWRVLEQPLKRRVNVMGSAQSSRVVLHGTLKPLPSWVLRGAVPVEPSFSGARVSLLRQCPWSARPYAEWWPSLMAWRRLGRSSQHPTGTNWVASRVASVGRTTAHRWRESRVRDRTGAIQSRRQWLGLPVVADERS